jgi:succinate dehydrogenase hydrophobic anchor subunit
VFVIFSIDKKKTSVREGEWIFLGQRITSCLNSWLPMILLQFCLLHVDSDYKVWTNQFNIQVYDFSATHITEPVNYGIRFCCKFFKESLCLLFQQNGNTTHYSLPYASWVTFLCSTMYLSNIVMFVQSLFHSISHAWLLISKYIKRYSFPFLQRECFNI